MRAQARFGGQDDPVLASLFATRHGWSLRLSFIRTMEATTNAAPETPMIDSIRIPYEPPSQ